MWEELKKRVFEKASQNKTIKVKLEKKVLKIVKKKQKLRGFQLGTIDSIMVQSK